MIFSTLGANPGLFFLLFLLKPFNIGVSFVFHKMPSRHSGRGDGPEMSRMKFCDLILVIIQSIWGIHNAAQKHTCYKAQFELGIIGKWQNPVASGPQPMDRN